MFVFPLVTRSGGRGGSVGIATRYELFGSGDRIPVGGEIFSTRPDRLRGPPSLLYTGPRVFPGGRAAGAWRGVDQPPLSIAEVEGKVEVYMYPPSGPS